MSDAEYQVRDLHNHDVPFKRNAGHDEPAAVVLASVLEAMVGVDDTTTVRELSGWLRPWPGMLC